MKIIPKAVANAVAMTPPRGVSLASEQVADGAASPPDAFVRAHGATSTLGQGVAVGAGLADPAMQAISPEFAAQFNMELATLPRAGELRRRPWSTSYLPDFKGGLAWRWHDASAKGQDFATYKLHTVEELLALPEAQRQKVLAVLSPAEKFDLLRGVGHLIVNTERLRARADAPSDRGLCHGTSMASLLLREPRAMVVELDSGLNVPFSSADFKAIAGYYFAQADGMLYQKGRQPPGVLQLGVRRDMHVGNSRENLQVNPAAFHAMLAQTVKARALGMVVDVDPGPQVWNSAVFKYESSVAEATGSRPYTATEQQRDLQQGICRAPGTRAIATVTTTLWYMPQTLEPPADKASGEPATAVYRYEVELDERGQLCGGRWLSEARPDTAWTPVSRFDTEAIGGIFDDFFYYYDLATGKR